jgi:hypothetical protein
MRNRLTFVLSAIVFATILGMIAFSPKVSLLSGVVETPSQAAFAGQPGHGGPSGPHYNLNIIGVPKDKTADMDSTQGHRIFVKLWGKSKILLAEGDDFWVLDANGTDADGAKFQLPDPFPDDDLVTRYVVYARALGRPGGWSYTFLCYQDEYGETVCSADTLELRRGHGQQKFVDVSKKLLTLWIDTDDDGVPDKRVGLFDEAAYQYFWDYDNHGLKLAQLRFYPITEDLGD